MIKEILQNIEYNKYEGIENNGNFDLDHNIRTLFGFTLWLNSDTYIDIPINVNKENAKLIQEELNKYNKNLIHTWNESYNENL